MKNRSARINHARVLVGAYDILESGSWSDFTVETLTRYLRTSKSTLYKVFASKEAVVDTLVGDVCTCTDGVLSTLAQSGARTADAEFVRFVDTYGNFFDGLPRAVINERTLLPATTLTRLMVTRVNLEGACRRILRLGRAQGVFYVEDPSITTMGVVAALDAVARVTSQREDVRLRGAKVRHMGRLLLKGLRQRP